MSGIVQKSPGFLSSVFKKIQKKSRYCQSYQNGRTDYRLTYIEFLVRFFFQFLWIFYLIPTLSFNANLSFRRNLKKIFPLYDKPFCKLRKTIPVNHISYFV